MRGKSRLGHDIAVRSVKLLNIILICIPLAYIWLTYYSKSISEYEFSKEGTILFVASYAVLYCVFIRIYDAFKISHVSASEMFVDQIIALFLTDIIAYLFLFAILRSLPEPFRFIVLFILQVITSALWCFIVSRLYFKVFKKRKAVIIYDSEHNLNEIAKHKQFQKSFELVGCYDIDETRLFADQQRIAWLIDKIKDVEVVFVMEIHSHERNALIKYCVENGISCYNEPKIGDILLSSSRQYNMYNLSVALVERYNPNPEYIFIKRVFDIILAGLSLIILSPVFAITALAIKIGDGGPVIYKQKRLTKDGRIFKILKFRSMRLDAEKYTGAVISSGASDPRVTKIGKVIRKCRIDELPQLLNIIKGDMSIVGPRPERPEIAEKYAEKLPEFGLRLQVRAGLTGYAQVYGRYDSDPYDKLCMDLHYISSASYSEDLRIMLVTIKRILFKEPEGNREEDDE